MGVDLQYRMCNVNMKDWSWQKEGKQSFHASAGSPERCLPPPTPLVACPLLELSHYVLNDYLVHGPWQNFSWFSASFGTCQHKQSKPHCPRMEGGQREEFAAQTGRSRKGFIRQEHLCAWDGIPLCVPLCSDLRLAIHSKAAIISEHCAAAGGL